MLIQQHIHRIGRSRAAGAGILAGSANVLVTRFTAMNTASRAVIQGRILRLTAFIPFATSG